MLKTILTEIYSKPEISAIKGAFVSCLFGMINIPETTEVMELIGSIIKTLGITAGSTVAIASLISYAKKNWVKPKNKQHK